MSSMSHPHDERTVVPCAGGGCPALRCGGVALLLRAGSRTHVDELVSARLATVDDASAGPCERGWAGDSSADMSPSLTTVTVEQAARHDSASGGVESACCRYVAATSAATCARCCIASRADSAALPALRSACLGRSSRSPTEAARRRHVMLTAPQWRVSVVLPRLCRGRSDASAATSSPRLDCPGPLQGRSRTKRASRPIGRDHVHG